MHNDETLPVIADDQIVFLAKKAEERIEAVNKIKRLALKVTNANDWVDQNGKPYLQASGAEKIARLFGISWVIDEPIIEYENDGHFTYTYKGKFTLGNVTIEAIGSRSSKDAFFLTRYISTQNGREKVTLPPSEIDKADVKKAAFTNCVGNGITRLLGIRNLTWDDLREAGIIKTEVQKVEYRTKEVKEESIREKFKKALTFYCEEDPQEMERICREASHFEKNGKTHSFGIDQIDTVKERWVSYAYDRLKDFMKADGLEVPDGS